MKNGRAKCSSVIKTVLIETETLSKWDSTETLNIKEKYVYKVKTKLTSIFFFEINHLFSAGCHLLIFLSHFADLPTILNL